MKNLNSLALWAALSILGVVLALGFMSTRALADNTSWVDHTHLVIESLDDIATSFAKATNARRGFSLTGESDESDRYATAVGRATNAEQRVRFLTLDNPSQQVRLDVLEPLLAKHIANLSAAIEYRRMHGFDANRETAEIGQASLAYDELSERLADLTAEEQRLLVVRERRTAESVVSSERIEAVGIGLSLSLFVIVIIRLRREIRRREHSEQAVRDSEKLVRRTNEDLERRVDERTAQLKTSNSELESFSYSVVHNLRAPLRGMAGFAEILLSECEDTLSDDTKDCLREIHRNAGRMATLIDALVSMSRIARTELRRTNVDLTDLAREVAGQLAPVSSRPPLVIEVEELLRGEVDASLARTLLEILIGNSWKFTGKTAATRIEFGVTDVDGEPAWFVRDNGAGFDMAHADKLFSAFGRLHTEGEFPGVGIGLATAQRIVRHHGGRIWADASVGGGATLYFTLCPTLRLGTS